jgi:rubrerythrin
MDALRVVDQNHTADEFRGLELAHVALDELGVPRLDEQGHRYTLFGRIEQLRAGKFDPSRISRPTPSQDLRRCGGCGLYVLSRPGDGCPSCGKKLEG